MSKLRLLYLRLIDRIYILKFFKNYSMFSRWPLGILLPAIFLNRHHIREFCAYCSKTLGFKPANRSGDSGGICSRCVKAECPELYEEMKAKGELTAQEILEAEQP